MKDTKSSYPLSLVVHINCQNWLPRIIIVYHTESKRSSRRPPRLRHHVIKYEKPPKRDCPEFRHILMDEKKYGLKNREFFNVLGTFIRGPSPCSPKKNPNNLYQRLVVVSYRVEVLYYVQISCLGKKAKVLIGGHNDFLSS